MIKVGVTALGLEGALPSDEAGAELVGQGLFPMVVVAALLKPAVDPHQPRGQGQHGLVGPTLDPVPDQKHRAVLDRIQDLLELLGVEVALGKVHGMHLLIVTDRGGSGHGYHPQEYK